MTKPKHEWEGGRVVQGARSDQHGAQGTEDKWAQLLIQLDSGAETPFPDAH